MDVDKEDDPINMIVAKVIKIVSVVKTKCNKKNGCNSSIKVDPTCMVQEDDGNITQKAQDYNKCSIEDAYSLDVQDKALDDHFDG